MWQQIVLFFVGEQGMEMFSISKKRSCLPVEYIEVQSPVPFETSSSCGNSMPGSTANGILSSGNQIKTRSSVVCETRMERVELLVV